MRVAAYCLLGVMYSAAHAFAAEPQALALARTLYNAANYDEAIVAATEACKEPSAVDAARLVLARAHLERYRGRGDAADLAAAREAFANITRASLNPRDQVDLLVGLGQSLFLGETFGAAAEIFEAALVHGATLPPRDRALLLDWWASALNREAQSRPGDRRAAVFHRIADRMEQELLGDPSSVPANYWLPAAMRGAGDLDRAWDIAIASWVRAALDPAGRAALRADLDRLVTEALAPERARQRPTREQSDALAKLHAEWNSVKEQWP